MYGKQKRELTLFIHEGPVEFKDMDILKNVLKTEKGNQFVVVVTDRNVTLS